MPSGGALDQNASSFSSDPFERAAAKIAAAKRAISARQELQTGSPPPAPAAQTPTTSTPIASQDFATQQAVPPTPSTAPPISPSVSTDPVQTAYRIIGVPYGSDFLTVQRTVEKLRQRCAPNLFAAGSPEQAQAAEILARVDEAYRVLQTALNAPDGRFDRLEF
jgi:hypothetical protein